jgi:hypothetical protein
LTLTFTAKFYAKSTKNATLTITADNTFSAKLNGGVAFTGNDWTKKYTFTLCNLVCGENTLVITVINQDAGSPAALIFAVTQDQSKCFECLSLLSYYNEKTCQCECISGCKSCYQANPLYCYKDYPVCGCACSRELSCGSCKHFNKNTCACECDSVSCLPGYKQSESTCLCEKIVTTCTPPLTWDSVSCTCKCGVTKACARGSSWSISTCSCFNPAPS